LIPALDHGMYSAERGFVYPSIQIGHVLVPVLSGMLGVGIVLLMVVPLLRSRRYNLKRSVAGGAVIAGLVTGIVAIRCLFGGFGQLRLGYGEVAVGWIAAAVGIKAWSDARRVSVRQLADCMAPALALFLMVMGIAGFLAGCDFGRPTDSPLGVTFTNGLALAWYGTPLGIALQPTQLYESALSAGIFAFLIVWERRRPPAGTLFLALCVTYAMGRFFLEFLRGDADRGFLWPLSIPQWFCLATLVVSAASWVYIRGWPHAQAMRSHLRGLHHPRPSTQHH
jgi:phosphatidylglycerol:prolipoprotein diacylglycerol transferase